MADTNPSYRLALVTGGTRGIGAAISRALQAAGRRVVASYRNGHEQAARFRDDTGIETVSFDVADLEQTRVAMADLTSRFGPVSVLVNNAGIIRDIGLVRMERDTWDAVLDTNLGSAFNLCRLLLPAMREQRWGRIVNITSVNGQTGQFGQTHYAAAKAGLQGFTRSLALECARYGVTVNALAPGYVETEMLSELSSETMARVLSGIPVGRLGQPEEIAAGVAFLTADTSGFVTGSTLSINGGQYMS
ncbi:acetoacetyl-CoA reductase [Rhizosaccharibacter radicis]|uniref:Acetoacetyl-CoA reductase n=1 Tax=Rhizosaccharibacter radicis TaxID=2782605 RepID=A0ABT1VX92_9PROT|nr:acetoacetyl-CoA reductase [Acetobacteraceae bacterium KSS12]